jgi:hypothetical protein
MTALFGEKVPLSQENGPDVELRVFGDEFYARYETDEGYTAVYDPARGLFYYASLRDGAFVPTEAPVTGAAPPGLERGLVEVPSVRTAKKAQRQTAMGHDAES